MAQPPLKQLQNLVDITVAPYLSFGRSRQRVCFGRRFNFTAAHPHSNKPAGKPTYAITDHEWILRTGELNPAPWRSPFHT